MFLKFSWAILSPNRAEVEKFKDRIHEISLRDNVYVVQGTHLPDPDFSPQRDLLPFLFSDELVPQERILRSNEFIAKDGTLFPYGHIRRSSWDNFIESAKKGDQIRVHGCYFGNGCTLNLAIQLYGHFEKGEHWFDWNSTESSFGEGEYPGLFPHIWEIARDSTLEVSGALSDFQRVRYGSVFSRSFAPSKALSFSGLPFVKSLDEQLSNDQTEIFGG